MYPVLHQLVSPPEQLGGDQDHRRGAIANLLVLLMRQVDQDLSRRVLDVEEAEDRSAVVCYCDILKGR